MGGGNNALGNSQPIGNGINTVPSVLQENNLESILTSSQEVPVEWHPHCPQHWPWVCCLTWMLLHPCLPLPAPSLLPPGITSHINYPYPFFVSNFAFGIIWDRHITCKVGGGHLSGALPKTNVNESRNLERGWVWEIDLGIICKNKLIKIREVNA